MTQTIFEKIKRINENGQEFWYARELAKVLQYADYSNFENVIKKAMIASKKSGNSIADHFGDTTEMLDIGSKAVRAFKSYKLSRYACYLIVQNADPSKKVVALAQTYFAVQTRKQETKELLDSFDEDRARVSYRDEITEKNKKLSGTAKSVGVTNFGEFHDAGYIGLYGGLRQREIKKLKKVPEKKNLLDHMGSEELAANIFRVSQANAKIRRENITGQFAASTAHRMVGVKVRTTIKELGGTMPEKLPAKKHIKESRKRIKGQNLQLKKLKS
jgi:DNA-damage-inducible protein D